jgi:hypothetical protein
MNILQMYPPLCEAERGKKGVSSWKVQEGRLIPDHIESMTDKSKYYN